MAQQEAAGSATLHNSSIAHGVSLHTRGVWYNLFFLQVPASTGSVVHGLESAGG